MIEKEKERGGRGKGKERERERTKDFPHHISQDRSFRRI